MLDKLRQIGGIASGLVKERIFKKSVLNSDIKGVHLDSLSLAEITQDNTDMRVFVNFPFSPNFPVNCGLELEGGHQVIYFEIPAGASCGTHRDSPEEIIVCLEGNNIETWCGDTTGIIEAEEITIIPAREPHGFRNKGDVTARFLGFFADKTNASEWEIELQPVGASKLKA